MTHRFLAGEKLAPLPTHGIFYIPSLTENLVLCQGDGTPFLSVTRVGEDTRVILTMIPDKEPPIYRDRPIDLWGKGSEGLRLVYTPARIALYCGQTLCDEDWPLGHLPTEECFCASAPEGVALTENLAFDEQYRNRGEKRSFTCLSEFRPSGHNTSIGDCMPFTDPKDGTYRLFYLYDRRHHRSKYGFGAHQWGQVSTKDGKTWQTEPMAITIDEPWEASICTGSIIEHDGTYYAFYAARMSDCSPAKLTCAVSTDCVHFEKTDRYFFLTPPYEPVEARDPKLFRDEAGIFHMLVTTRYHGEGALAHLTSTDLISWEQKEPFYLQGDENWPECADVFALNGRYYLVYSINGEARYLMADSLLGEYRAPCENNVIVDADYRVPKAARLGDRLIFSAFMRDEGEIYGGHIEQYEAVADSEGILHFQRFDKNV